MDTEKLRSMLHLKVVGFEMFQPGLTFVELFPGSQTSCVAFGQCAMW